MIIFGQDGGSQTHHIEPVVTAPLKPVGTVTETAMFYTVYRTNTQVWVPVYSLGLLIDHLELVVFESQLHSSLLNEEAAQTGQGL